MPSFEGADARLRLTEGDPIYIRSAYVEDSLVVGNAMSGASMAQVTLRLSARSLRTGRTFTRVAVGRTDPMRASRQRVSGSALEKALHAVIDSLAAHRAELERVSPSPKS